MIDWHSHVLPKMDDGSRSVDESIAMLEALHSQGVDRVAATPHFYADDESVDSFLSRRESSFAKLSESTKKTDKQLPTVYCGAEVRYYPGICRLSGLERLKIESTKLLLLEMPMARWTDYTLNELTELAHTRTFSVMLAHIERYMPLQDNGVYERLCEDGLLMQVNASYFIESKRKALKFLSERKIHFIGSDCHNMSSRPPRIGSAFEVVSKKFGDDFLSRMMSLGYYMFEHI